MTSKLRIEYVRPKRAGDGHDLDPDAIEQILGYGGTLSVSGTSQQAAAMSTYASDRGLTGGVYARLTCLSGAVVAAIGADPTAAEATGIRLEIGDCVLLPIEAGQKVAAIEAADAPVGSDLNGAAFQGEVAMTVGQAYAAGRSLKVICAVAGDVAVTYADGSTGIWAVFSGTQTLPIAVTAVNASGTTATATYSNLK